MCPCTLGSLGAILCGLSSAIAIVQSENATQDIRLKQTFSDMQRELPPRPDWTEEVRCHGAFDLALRTGPVLALCISTKNAKRRSRGRDSPLSTPENQASLREVLEAKAQN